VQVTGWKLMMEPPRKTSAELLSQTTAKAKTGNLLKNNFEWTQKTFVSQPFH
jgi:hypothetical protein